MNDLEQLRERIRKIDEDILRLIAARQETAKAIGQQKKSEGIPLRDWDVERQVLDRAARQAEAFDVSPTVARDVMQMLIAASRDEQERTSYSTYRGSAESILIVGGAGTMGRWFVDFFANQGHDVHVFDPAGANGRTLAEALDGTSFALIAAPLDAIAGVLDEIATSGYTGTVFDIASLKSHLREPLARAREAGLSVTSIHPMFGAGVQTLANQVVCICDCGDPEATHRVEGFFTDTAATLVKLSLDEHDVIVSYVLGLSHLTNLVFTRVLMNSGKSLRELNTVGSTTFHSQMVTTATVVQDNPDLYYTIQTLNSRSPELWDVFERELATVCSWLRSGDREAFVNMMKAGQAWVNGHDTH